MDSDMFVNCRMPQEFTLLANAVFYVIKYKCMGFSFGKISCKDLVEFVVSFLWTNSLIL